MKRAFLFLMVAVFWLYGQLGYELVMGNRCPDTLAEGNLSDIAEEVTAIPLLTGGEAPVGEVRQVRQEGNDLFLISDSVLYRFDRSGRLLGRITDRRQIEVAGYLVDSVHRQLIVLGNINDIHYYSFDGELLAARKLGSSDPAYRVLSAALCGGEIWTTEEGVSGEGAVTKEMVRYDLSFRRLASYPLQAEALPERMICSSFAGLDLGIDPDSGHVYAYAPHPSADYLYRDTLQLKRKRLIHGNVPPADQVMVYPFRLGGRYWIASYQDAQDPSKNYTYCYDHKNDRSWQLPGGFKDNVYHTGYVSRLQSMDLYNKTYCFSKPGVVFIVRLKG